MGVGKKKILVLFSHKKVLKKKQREKIKSYALPDFHNIVFSFWLSSQRVDVETCLSQNINYTRIV